MLWRSEPRRRPGLEPSPLKAKGLETTPRDHVMAVLPLGSQRALLRTDMNQPIEKRARRNHESDAHRVALAGCGAQAPAILGRRGKGMSWPFRRSTDVRLRRSSADFTQAPYRRLSAWARGDQTAGPRYG